LIILLTTPSFARKPVEESESEVSEFQEPEVVKASELRYPPNSIAYGVVVLEVTIGTEGNVEAMKARRDIVSLTPEAIRAVKVWKFKPAKLDGKPIRSKTMVAVVFNPALNNPPESVLPPLANHTADEQQAPCFSPPQVIQAVYPKYPIRSVAWGTVVLQLKIDAEGRAQAVKTLRDIVSLTPEAAQTVRAWKFVPGTLDGKRVPSTTTVAFLFRRPFYPKSR
jgi:outer membrane biosynthesis protein TonB